METIIIVIAAFCAGTLNTIAGGGTFITFPALVFVGLPPVAANATSAVAVLPGYLGGALGFRGEFSKFDRVKLAGQILVTLAGSTLGALLLLYSSDQVFSLIVPFLLLGATLVFLFGDRIQKWAAASERNAPSAGAFGLFLVCIYGGYFNGGVGIVLLALFALWGMKDIHEMNALKNGLSFPLSAVSVAVFAIGGLIDWSQALVMMAAAVVGGYCGAPIARRMPKTLVRGLIAFVGFTMSTIFFVRLFS